jgi:hypothetical protein
MHKLHAVAAAHMRTGACAAQNRTAADLDCEAAADALDTVHDVYALVDADDVWVCCCHALQQAAAAADVQNDGQLGVGLLHTVNHLRTHNANTAQHSTNTQSLLASVHSRVQRR